MVSTREYVVTEFREFNAPLGIEPPVAERSPTGEPSQAADAPKATPVTEP
jgi:hypothetical protein